MSVVVPTSCLVGPKVTIGTVVCGAIQVVAGTMVWWAVVALVELMAAVYRAVVVACGMVY